MNPNALYLPKQVDKIHRETELSLLQTPVHQWTPVLVNEKYLVIDGVQRVLVARKYGFQIIPVQFPKGM